MNDFYDAFQEMKGLEDETFSFDKPGILKLKTFIDDDGEEREKVVSVVDPEAENDDELKDDYSGEVILKCCVCDGLITKSPKDVVIDKETNKANVDEECPYCYNVGGFDVVAQIDVPEKLEYEEVDEFDDEPVDESCTTSSKRDMKESYEFYSEDDGKVTAECYTKSTRTYNYEYVDLTVGSDDSTGKYRWMNRPWYKFKFSDAFIQAAGYLGYKDEAKKAVDDSHDIEEAVKKFAEIIKEKRNSVEDEKNVDKLSEDFNTDPSKIKRFLEDSVKGLVNGDATNYRFKLDDRFAIFVGWSEGYDEDDEDVIHDKEDPSFAVTAGVKVWTSDGMWTDFDYLNYPYYDNGDVLDAYYSVSEDEDYTWLANELLDDYRRVKDFNVDTDGKIVEGKTNIKELRKPLVKKAVNESPTYDLRPESSSQKSFYNKARVESKDGVDTLYSYNTKVAEIKDGDVLLFPKWNLSQTTLRHVKEFLKQHGFKAESMRQIASDYPTQMEESKGKSLMEEFKGGILEFPSGDYLYVAVEDGKLVAGSATNVGIIHEYELDIEGEEPTDRELQELYELIIKEHPEYEDEITESCKKGKKFQGKTKKLDEGVKIISELSDYTPWSGAVDTWNTIEENDAIDALDDYLESAYPEGLTETELNDLLWFDGDSILDEIGILSESKIEKTIEDTVDNLKSKYGESFESTKDLEDRIVEDVSYELNGKDVDVEFDEDSFKVTVGDSTVEFELSDFDVSKEENESLKEAKEEVEDLYDIVYDTVTGQRSIKGTSNKIVGCVNPDDMGVDRETGNMLARCKTQNDVDRVVSYVSDNFGDKGVTTTVRKNPADRVRPFSVVINVPEKDIIMNIDDKVTSTKDESLKEGVENVTVTTSDDIINVKTDGSDGIVVDAHSKDDKKESQVIAPVSDETKEEISVNSEEDEDGDVSDEFDEFEESDFDDLGESYLKEVYNNVKSFKTTKGYADGNRIKLEGIIEFNSGKTAKTSFVFEKFINTKRGKIKLIGENIQMTNRKNAFVLTGHVENRKLCMESLTYKYTAKDAKGGKSKKAYGTVRVK